MNTDKVLHSGQFSKVFLGKQPLITTCDYAVKRRINCIGDAADIVAAFKLEGELMLRVSDYPDSFVDTLDYDVFALDDDDDSGKGSVSFIVMQRYVMTLEHFGVEKVNSQYMGLRHVAHNLLDEVQILALLKINHSGINPENILLMYESGDPGRITSYSLHLGGFASARDITGITCGKVDAPALRDHKFDHFFASPERVLQKEVSVTSDIWSVGAVLCYIISGKVPTGDMSLLETEAAYRGGKWGLQLDHDSCVYGDMVLTFVENLLQFNPEHRPRGTILDVWLSLVFIIEAQKELSQ